MRVVATTGMPGAGKELAVDIAEEIGLPVVRMGDLVREETERRGLPDEPESYGQVAVHLRAQEGPGIWAQRTIERIEQLDAETVLIDGVRSLVELDTFRDALGDNLLVVAVLASPTTRYERMLKRGRGEDADSIQALRERDERELGHGLGDVIAMADAYIENEGTIEQAQASLRGVLGA